MLLSTKMSIEHSIANPMLLTVRKKMGLGIDDDADVDSLQCMSIANFLDYKKMAGIH